MGSLLASVFGGGAKVAKARGQQSTAQIVNKQRAENIRSAEETEAKKGKAAQQLALIRTSRAGLTGEAPTGRRKLLGN